MDPQIQPQQPNEPPAAPVPPATPVAPQPPVAPAPPAPLTPTGPLPPAPVMGTKKSKTGLIIGIVVLVIVALIGAAAAWIFMFSPAAQAKKASTEFMNAASAGDNAKLYAITNSQTDEEKAFLDSVVEGTKGSYSLKEMALQNNVGYFLYDLSNESGKMGRTTVEKKDGKYTVTGYDWGSDNLALIPGASTEPTATETETTPSPTAGSCLVASDFDGFYKEQFGDSHVNTLDNSKTGTSNNIHFKANSLEYEDIEPLGYLTPYANFSKDYESKDFTIEMYGSVGSQDASKIALANKRVEKVKQAYLKAGGVESKLVIIKAEDTEIQNMDDEYNSVDQGRDRVVVFKIVPSAACGGSPTAQ